MAATRYPHGHAPTPAGSLRHLDRNPRTRTAEINAGLAAAVAAAASRTETLADAARQLHVTEATVRRYCYSAAGKPARLTAVRDENGRIVGVTQGSVTSFRRRRTAYRYKVAAYRKACAAHAA